MAAAALKRVSPAGGRKPAVQPIDAPAVSHDAIVYLGAVFELANELLQVGIHISLLKKSIVRR